MLKGDIGSGVSNSDPYHPDPKNADDYTETSLRHSSRIRPLKEAGKKTTDKAKDVMKGR